jgi:tagatose 1,6-diphosphate aldolase
VEKIKRLGASAVKLLVYFRPDLKDLARRQLNTIEEVAGECQTHDVPLFVEPVSYAVGKEASDPRDFARHKPEFVIETARQITALPIDVLKAEFPADMKYETDPSRLKELCRELDKASRVPWVLLSGGVDIDTFYRQVDIACATGASGFLGGRAIWQEVMPMSDAAQRVRFLTTTVAERFKRLNDCVMRQGRPWFKKYGPSVESLATLSEDWYRKY